MLKSFASDNYAPISPQVLQSLSDANSGHSKAYGQDELTQNAIAIFKNEFGAACEVFFVANGTAANVLALSHILRPFEAVICTESAHINTDECGAFENYIGSKILTLPTKDGKLSAKQLKSYFVHLGDQHRVQPKVISLSQSTEFGTVYTLDELKEITQFAKQHQLLVHMDGARLSNAAASLNLNLKEFTTDIGIDVITFGGTKNGIMLGEAIIFSNADIAKEFQYVRKQGMQLISKMRFISAQFIGLFKDQLWLKNSQHSNLMAQILALEIQKSLLPTKIQIPNIKIASSYFPAIDVAGDIFDYFEISPGRVLLMCSDVAGKGIQACLYSLGFRGFVRSVSVFEKDLDKIVSQVNDLYLKDTSENCMFVTAWIGILDTTSKTLEYVSCGHPPALLRRHDLPVELLEGEGIPFGIQKMDEIKVQKVQLKSKDLVIAYTDGVTEAMNDAKQLYGMDRLITAIRNIDVASPENLIEDLYRRIKEFSSKEQSDDITILAIQID